mmetsp:Transcript_16641/g.63282  ORF Transcript_16641/g.63282 Transcript_16641/m.63282 type:complete len:244 (-) Transcript_16641:1442-2173(-)
MLLSSPLTQTLTSGDICCAPDAATPSTSPPGCSLPPRMPLLGDVLSPASGLSALQMFTVFEVAASSGLTKTDERHCRGTGRWVHVCLSLASAHKCFDDRIMRSAAAKRLEASPGETEEEKMISRDWSSCLASSVTLAVMPAPSSDTSASPFPFAMATGLVDAPTFSSGGIHESSSGTFGCSAYPRQRTIQGFGKNASLLNALRSVCRMCRLPSSTASILSSNALAQKEKRFPCTIWCEASSSP